MRSIFKTGTFLTAKNLNLAQRASGFFGIIEGCDVSNEDKLITIGEGIAKFEDGTIVSFDGNESIDTSSFPVGEYKVVVIKYSDYSLSYDLVKNEPEYEFIKLADVVIKTNSMSIVNSYKASSPTTAMVLDCNYLKSYLNDYSVSQVIEDNGVMSLHFNVTPESNVDSGTSKKYSVGFIATGIVSKIVIKGNLEDYNRISFELKVNGVQKILQGETTASSISLNCGNDENDVDFALSIPYGVIKKNSKCCLIMRLFTSQDTAQATIYNITIN